MTFSREEIVRLRKLNEHHPHYVVRQRALILILKSEKISHQQIAKIADVCENTVRHYFGVYQEGGIEELVTLNFYHPQSQLKPFETVIREYFEKTPPATISQACANTAASLKFPYVLRVF